MAFTLPTFNLAINVWHSGLVDPVTVPPVGPPSIAGLLVNWSLGRRVLTGTDTYEAAGARAGTGIDLLIRVLLAPAGTDLRSSYQGDTDVLEVPAGSGAYYHTLDVADMAKGFANEHRLAWCIPFRPDIPPFYSLPIPLP